VRLAILHYSAPPTIGGVEQTIYYHGRVLAERGHSPRVIAGTGETFGPGIELVTIAQMSSSHPEVLQVKAQLDQGQTTEPFRSLVARLTNELRSALEGVPLVIIHNALGLHKNLALTAALWNLLQAKSVPRWIAWHHDLAWQRPEYRHQLHPGDPWDLLRKPWPGVRNVVVSEYQRGRLAALYELPSDEIRVVRPGIDLAVLAGLSPTAAQLVDRLELAAADGLLLLPARITRRKNIEFAIRTLAALRALAQADYRLLVSGPPGPHNPENRRYLEELSTLRAELGLETAVHFLYELTPPSAGGLQATEVAELYRLCDALFFPSLEEGFGIPILEAGYSRLPVFCSDIPPLREAAGDQAWYFSLSEGPEAAARLVFDRLSQDRSFALRQRIRRDHSWYTVVQNEVIPLLGDGSNA
jgi:glycosyltransferase involved in cell wall biosynthesis